MSPSELQEAAMQALRSKPTLSVDEYAALVGIHRITVYAHVKQGAIPAIRVGRRIRIPSAVARKQLSVDTVPPLDFPA